MCYLGLLIISRWGGTQPKVCKNYHVRFFAHFLTFLFRNRNIFTYHLSLSLSLTIDTLEDTRNSLANGLWRGITKHRPVPYIYRPSVQKLLGRREKKQKTLICRLQDNYQQIESDEIQLSLYLSLGGWDISGEEVTLSFFFLSTENITTLLSIIMSAKGNL